MTTGLPSTFIELLVLAGVLTFLITSIGAFITTMLISRNGVLYLGSQLALLFLSIYLSRRWSHALVFGAMFSSPDTLGRAAAAAVIVATAFAADMALKYWVWEGAALQEGRVAVPRLLIGVTRLMVYLVTC